jgi:glycerate kinase
VLLGKSLALPYVPSASGIPSDWNVESTMKVVIAPDKFKGSLGAAQVAAAIAAGLRRADPHVIIDECPIADGGEGTVAALVAATAGRLERRRVTGPLPEMKIEATFGILGDGQTAVVEMAEASGLALLRSEDRNPLNTTTFGTGELLMAAASLGVRHIVLGIGGSATVDGGIGCAQACGLPIILEDGEPVAMTEPLCGRDLDSVVLIKHGRGSPIERIKISVACDVTNPLYGPSGAAVVFGPQKGASPEQVRWLDNALRGLAERTGKSAEAQVPGSGAAGGLGFGMLAYFSATLANGAGIVIEATRLRQRLAGADLCLTGEGRLDAGSLHGKAPIAVARLCKALGIPCIALIGSVGEGAERALAEGLRAYFPVSDGSMPLEACVRRAPELLEALAERVMLRRLFDQDA